MKIQHPSPARVSLTPKYAPPPEPPPPPPTEQGDQFIEAGFRWGLVGGLGLSALLASLQGSYAIALSAIPTGALLGVFVGVGLQLIEDS